MAIKKGLGQKKVKLIAKRFGLSLGDAKRFWYDRKQARLEGRNLPFHKWRKKNLDVSQTKEGNDVEQGDFDNFFSRKKRKAIARKLRKASPRSLLKGIHRKHKAILTGGLSELKKRRLLKVRKHKGLLRKLADPRFLANPRNVLKLRGRIKNMAKAINKNDKRIIRKAEKLHSMSNPFFGRRPIGRPNPYYSQGRPAVMHRPDYREFAGDDQFSDSTFLNADGGIMGKVKKYKWWLVGGAVAFLFFTPMGKKLIK